MGEEDKRGNATWENNVSFNVKDLDAGKHYWVGFTISKKLLCVECQSHFNLKKVAK